MFEGVYVAAATPFTHNELDEKAFRELIRFLINGGVSGIVPCGTTGESPTLSHKEHNRVIEIAVDECKGKVKVLAGTGSNSTAEAVSLSQHAEQTGVDGVLLTTPYYNKPTQEGLYEHYKTIAESIKIPVMLYNVPSRASVGISVETIVRLFDVKNIVAIKEATADLNRTSQILQGTKHKMEVLSGDDATNLPLMALGGVGMVSVIANIAPKLCSDMVKAMNNNDLKQAQEIHYKLLDLSNSLFTETNPIPVKYALTKMGIFQNELRLPLVPLSKQAQPILDHDLKSLGLI